MGGSGTPNNLGKDEDVTYLLLSRTKEQVMRGIGLIHERHGLTTWVRLRVKFPGLSNAEREDIYFEGLCTLALKALGGSFKDQHNGTGALALFAKIVRCDAIDCLRKKTRRRDVQLGELEQVEHEICDGHNCFDESWDSTDLLSAIEDFLNNELPTIERHVLRNYVRLVCEGHAKETGRLPLPLLVAEVNKGIPRQQLPKKMKVESLSRSGGREASSDVPQRRLSKKRVLSLLHSGRRKLHEFLIDKDFIS